ncbi:MAG TPA: VWA domain-containing protein [Blastocatellia bacterium]|nr:VWA domain-containing protein [Blastocatellia bacterium]
MKFMKIYTLAVILILAVAFSSIAPANIARGQQPNPPASGQQKTQKDKKPAEDEAPQDDQIITLGTELVTVPFNVTDKKNHYITDLGKDDVEVLEDNKPQQVFSFERQTDLPITIAMVIDVSISEEATLPYEKEAGKRFFSRVLRPKKDLGAVITFEGDATLVQGLTSDPERIQRALDEVRITAAGAVARSGVGTPPINGDSRAGSTAIWDAVYSVSTDLLSREAGRRVIILITDGQDTSSRVKMREAIERTWRKEVIIYSIGIGDPGYGGVDSGSLKKIASETGGRAFFPRNETDLDEAFKQIDEDLRTQYLLAYTSTNGSKDGSFRTIQLRVKSRKDMVVRHRRGYFAKAS